MSKGAPVPTLESSHQSRLKRTHLTSNLAGELEKEVVLTGWVHDVRALGGIAFLLLRDMAGIVQITAPKSKVSTQLLSKIGELHQEDVVAVRGRVVPSKIARRGLEVIPDELEVLSRAETPLPLDPRGVQNTLLETRLNWRGLGFCSEGSNAIFKIKLKNLGLFRGVFLQRPYVEIQPPGVIFSAGEGGGVVFSLEDFE